MSAHSSIAAQSASSDTNEKSNSSGDYEITGSLNDELYRKYDELLVKMDEIIKRAHSKRKVK